jgi:hypothetical protein
MRFLVAAAVLALSLAPAAGAMFGPPIPSVPSTLHNVQVVSVKDAQSRAPLSCMVHAKRSTGTVGKVERKLAPVACEQPPRSNVKGTGTGFGFFFRLSP